MPIVTGPIPIPIRAAEYRVRENREAVHANQDGAVTDPRRMNAFVRPRGEVRRARRQQDLALSILCHSLP